MAGLGHPKKTGRELTSINDIFDPKFKGQVTMLTEMRDTLGLVMLALGKDPSDATRPTRRRPARGSRRPGERTDPQVHRQRLRRGPGRGEHRGSSRPWSGDIQGLSADNPDLRWVAPKEGAMLVLRQHADPKTSDRQAQALAFMNYVYQPAHSAQIIAEAPYISPVKGAGEELAKIAPSSPRARW